MDVEEQRAVKRRREVQSCAREVHSDGSVHAPDRLVQKIQPQPGKPAPVSMATNRAVQLLPRQDRDRSELHFVTYSGVFSLPQLPWKIPWTGPVLVLSLFDGLGHSCFPCWPEGLRCYLRGHVLGDGCGCHTCLQEVLSPCVTHG